MIKWWLSLMIEQQITLSIALASTSVILVQIVLVLINFYGVDKLTADSEYLEQYETVANYDSDMAQHKTKIISIMAINIFLCVTCWTFFITSYKLQTLEQILFSFVLGLFSAMVYSIFRKIIKRQLREIQKVINEK